MLAQVVFVFLSLVAGAEAFGKSHRLVVGGANIDTTLYSAVEGNCGGEHYAEIRNFEFLTLERACVEGVPCIVNNMDYCAAACWLNPTCDAFVYDTTGDVCSFFGIGMCENTLSSDRFVGYKKRAPTVFDPQTLPRDGTSAAVMCAGDPYTTFAATSETADNDFMTRGTIATCVSMCNMYAMCGAVTIKHDPNGEDMCEFFEEAQCLETTNDLSMVYATYTKPFIY